MNVDEIHNALMPKCRGQFLGVYACDRLPRSLPNRRPLLIVANTDPHDMPGQHWIAMHFGADAKGEYFDSLGQPTPQIFKRYLSKYCISWKPIGRQLFRLYSISSRSIISFYCGHYVIYYCLYRSLGYSMERLISVFAHDTALNDALVHSLVCGHLM